MNSPELWYEKQYLCYMNDNHLRLDTNIRALLKSKGKWAGLRVSLGLSVHTPVHIIFPDLYVSYKKLKTKKNC